MEVVIHLFGKKVRGMICCDSLYRTFAYCGGDGFAVCRCLYGRIAFDEGTVAVIVVVVKPHVVDAYFRAYARMCLSGLFYGSQFICCADMEYMQAGTVPFGHFYGFGG